MQVNLLGPVEVRVGSAPRAVSGLRRKAVLATLALHPGQVVSTDRLIDVVWGEEAPAIALNTLQSHVSSLRQLFGKRSAIVARPPGYLLDIGSEATDVEVVERLVRQARESADPMARVACLAEAVSMWRGEPLADTAGLPWLEEQARHLSRLRLDVMRALAEARLALGEHTELIPELERLVQEHPLDEQSHGHLMLALYRAGRQGDALAAYRRLRDTLSEELGIDPSQALRELESAILRQDEAVASPAVPVPVESTVDSTVPAQLPIGVRNFAGRDAELATLDGLLGTRSAVAVLSGTAGVGKSALAVHWAHRAAPRFPDGQLYVNLRGFDPARPPVDAAEALRGFLEALGVPAARLPADRDALVGLYRSRLAGKRVLLMLDNAHDAEQIRPLLPGTPGCLVVVTSRNQLTPLVVAQGAHPLLLGLLSPADAWDLLAQRIGTARVAAEPEAIEEIIARCARLPLALAIAAARAATHPAFPLAALAAQLREAAGGLEAFRGGDPETDVWTVFSWSYRRLNTDAARMFRLLGLHPGPDISPAAAASLAGITRSRAAALLADLARANLLAEHTVARYACHDLLRGYAAELVAAEPAGDSAAATRRMLDHYLHSAHAAALRLHPHFSSIDVGAPEPGAGPEDFADRAEATAWYRAELDVLLAAVPSAASSGHEAHAWRLAWSIAGFLDGQGHWQDWSAIQCAAVDAATRLDDSAGQGHALRDMARVCSRLGRHDAAAEHLRRALNLFEAAGEDSGQAHAYLNLGQVTERQGNYRTALRHSRRALKLFQRAENLAGQAYTLNAIGWQLTLLGEQEQAVSACEEALVLLQKVGDVQGEADAWDSLGYAHHRLHAYDSAIACYENALRLFAEAVNRYGEACTHVNLGETHRAMGEHAAARAAWTRALSILDALGHADADRVRADLSALAPEPAAVAA